MSTGGRMRLAVLTRHFGKRFGGAEHYSVAVVEQLAQKHDIHVFAQEIEHEMAGVHYHRISRPFRKPRWLNQLWYAGACWWLTRRGFDLVHSHENTWHGDIQTMHVRPFKTGVMGGHSGLKRWLRWLTLCMSPRLLTYWFLERARMHVQKNRSIVAASETLRRELLLSYPHVSPMLRTIPPGVELITQHIQDGQVQGRMRTQLGLPQNVALALFVGNDYIKKGLPVLLQALVRVPELHLAVVGNNSHERHCQQLTDRLGISPRVHFLGALPDVTPAYDAANLLVHPTTEDSYAMVVLEAMAHGLPVIVSNAPFCGISADLTHHQQALLLDDPHDDCALTEHLIKLLGSQPLQQLLSIEGREFASKRSWLAVAKQYDLIFRTALL